MGYMNKLNELELYDTNEWKGDVRKKLIKLFEPIIEGTEYSLKMNTGDKGSKIIDVFKNDSDKRILIISQKKDMKVDLAINRDLYEVIKKQIELPNNQKEYKSQPHMRVSLKTAYDVLCILAQKQYMIEKL